MALVDLEQALIVVHFDQAVLRQTLPPDPDGFGVGELDGVLDGVIDVPAEASARLDQSDRARLPPTPLGGRTAGGGEER